MPRLPLHWTWDIEKASANLRKHGVGFDLAVRVFDDPFALSLPDPHEGEERWRTLGKPSADYSVLLFVVHTWDEADEGGRIISARRAQPQERKAYEEGQF